MDASDSTVRRLVDSGLYEEAFRLLVRTHSARIYGVVGAMGVADADVPDVVQEVYLRAFKGISRFRWRSSLSTWLYRVALNAAASHHRRASRAPTDSLGEEERLANGSSPDADRRLDLESEQRRLHRALAGLPEKQRAALALFYFHDRSYREIAAVLETSVDSVKVTLHRGKKALAARMDRHADEGGS